MKHTYVLLLAFSVAVPAVTAWIRFKKINRIYYPFLICTGAAFLNELTSYVLIDIFHLSNSVNNNIYEIIEALLYLQLFKNFNLFHNKNFYILSVAFISICWLADSPIVSGSSRFSSGFTILYSLMMVFMSITLLNRLILSDVNLLMHPIFILCIGFIVYFSLLALIEIFWLYGLNSSRSFRLNIYRIMAYINLFVNLLFALAILWMHRKREFIPQQL